MFWRTQGHTDYLIRESAGGAQKSLGPRGPQTQVIHDRFQRRKSEASSRLTALTASAHNQQRLNKALQADLVKGLIKSPMPQFAIE